ncbi:MAG: response regulator transcription factor [Chloroflexaceae bacterium]|jgi:DNA-binding NarL/FixJ family response regulator|nr:response regulator transcription factor [Chloroflexaceae bacterium]
MSAKIRVLIVDDQALIRLGIQSLLNRKPDIEVVGQASDGAEALRQVAALDPDVVLMDVQMPGMDGVEATRRLSAAGPRPAVIILTTFRDDATVFPGLEAGARGYLLKGEDHKALADAVRTVAAGNALIHPEVTAQVLREFARRNAQPATPAAPAPTAPPPPAAPSAERLALLTEREREIMRLLAHGQNNQEISDALAISIGTVKNHISSILTKLDARDRTQAALIAQQAGL